MQPKSLLPPTPSYFLHTTAHKTSCRALRNTEDRCLCRDMIASAAHDHEGDMLSRRSLLCLFNRFPGSLHRLRATSDPLTQTRFRVNTKSFTTARAGIYDALFTRQNSDNDTSEERRFLKYPKMYLNKFLLLLSNACISIIAVCWIEWMGSELRRQVDATGQMHPPPHP